jgi:hypothetical protein
MILQMQKRETKMRILFLKLFLTAMIFTIVGAHTLDNESNVNVSDYRLSKNIIPRRYNITIFIEIGIPSPIQLGECAIDIIISKPTLNIHLHVLHLMIYKRYTKLVCKDFGTEYKPVEHKYDLITNILNLQFDKLIRPGFYTLYIKYTSVAKDLGKEAGFFYISFPIKGIYEL